MYRYNTISPELLTAIIPIQLYIFFDLKAISAPEPSPLRHQDAHRADGLEVMHGQDAVVPLEYHNSHPGRILYSVPRLCEMRPCIEYLDYNSMPVIVLMVMVAAAALVMLVLGWL
ncbi:hypothetical protein GGR56DRAFT_637662 [Xylariaceae sp. FL0804]|nr:hypothetical protein GGR56DRAFT_637662 [Xylariaceae sp. FL0804]